MYITGGIGSLPEMEGFGRDYELDPEFAYAETCAALGSIFWNWEMAQLTKMATGSGKTLVMAMMMVWSYFHKLKVEGSDLSKNFLIVVIGNQFV